MSALHTAKREHKPRGHAELWEGGTARCSKQAEARRCGATDRARRVSRLAVDEEGEILGHEARLDGADDGGLEGGGKASKALVAVELGAVR